MYKMYEMYFFALAGSRGFCYHGFMDVISVTEGRKRLGELMDIVRYEHRVIALGKHGKAEALLIAVPDLDDEVPTTAINADSPSFAFLRDEPELYSRKDLRKRYV